MALALSNSLGHLAPASTALKRQAMRSNASIGSSLNSAGSQPSGPAEVLGPARAVSHTALP
eukprot:2293736-Alexandrium_andersonii.AAC.1